MRRGSDPAGGLVEHEQVGLRDGYRSEREPLPLARREVARMPLGRPGEVEPAECHGGPAPVAAYGERHLVEHALAHDVATRILRDVARAAGALDLPRSRLQETRGDLRERRLPHAVRPFESDDLAPADHERGAVEHRRQAFVGERCVFHTDNVSLPIGRRRLLLGVVVRPPCRRGDGQPGRSLVDRDVERDASALEEDHAVGEPERTRDAVLAEDDCGTRTAGRVQEGGRSARVELRGRLVEQQERGPERQRSRETHALQLAAAQLRRTAAGEVLGADRGERLARARANLGRRRAQVLQTEGDLGGHARHDDLVLGILEHSRDGSGEVGRTGAARVAAADGDAPGEAAAVEVRHQAGQRAEERGLPRAGGAEQGDALARLDRERHVPEGRHAAGVRERQPVDGR